VAGSIVNWTLDARGTGGLGKIEIDIVHDKQSLPHTIDHIGNSIYNVSLHTRRPGKYKIYVYFNGATVKGEYAIQKTIVIQSYYGYNQYNNYYTR